MISSWNKLIGVILMLYKMASLTHGCSSIGQGAYFSVLYVELGRPFTLFVSIQANKEQHTWRKDGKLLALPNCTSTSRNCTKNRIYTFKDNPSIVFNRIALEDSGKYILESSRSFRRVDSFKIIVEAKSLVYIDCNDMTVYEGDNISCVCTAANRNRNATVRWLRTKPEQENSGMKNFTDILILENISRNQSGTYTCFDESHNMVNKTSFNLKVVPRNSTHAGVKMEYFKVFQEVGFDSSKIFLLCKADGVPEPRYTISHNGTVVKYENIYTVDKGEISSLGQYECLARNGVSSDKRLLRLNASFLVQAFSDKEKVIYKDEMEWKVGLIVGVCSFLAGILALYVLMCSCKKFSKKEDGCENTKHVDDSPRSAQEGLGPANENVEVRLRHTTESPGDEELGNREEYELPVFQNGRGHIYYNEGSNYKELSEFRDKDEERYQSLNPIDS